MPGQPLVQAMQKLEKRGTVRPILFSATPKVTCCYVTN